METFPKKPPYFIITLDRHAGVFLMVSQAFIPPVLPGVAWHIGFAIENMSRFGLGTDKWNDDVKADGQSLCSRGNSAWPLAPHWNLFPYPGIPINPNLLIPLLIILSSSKNVLAVGSVVAKQGPIAVMIPGVKVVGVNLACNDPFALPTDIVLVGSSTVVLGFTLGDLLAALLDWAIEIILAYVMKVIGKVVGALGKKLVGKLGQKLAGKFTSGLGNKVGNFMQKIGGLGAKGPPGLLKRAHLNALGELNVPKVFNQPKAPGGLFGKLDDMMGAGWVDDVLGKHGFPIDKAVKPGQFQSVAETLMGVEKQYFDELVKNPLKDAAKDAGKEALFGPKPEGYAPSIGEKFGAWIDGRSEMISPMTTTAGNPAPKP